MKKTTKNWIATSDYDLKTAESLLKSGRKIYVIFMCHLAIEKFIKAIISEKQDRLPPYTHNLLYLLGLSEIDLPKELRNFVELINDKSVPTRYPEDISALNKKITLSSAKDYLSKTKELIQWLKQNSPQTK